MYIYIYFPAGIRLPTNCVDMRGIFDNRNCPIARLIVTSEALTSPLIILYLFHFTNLRNCFWSTSFLICRIIPLSAWISWLYYSLAYSARHVVCSENRPFSPCNAFALTKSIPPLNSSLNWSWLWTPPIGGNLGSSPAWLHNWSSDQFFFYRCLRSSNLRLEFRR